MMRYNLLFSQQITLTIPADLSLHAGDAIFVDTPEIKDNKNDTVDRQQGGLYIISDLCHYIASNKSLTKMNLVRESFGKQNQVTKHGKRDIETHIEKDKKILEGHYLIHKCVVILKANCMT